MDTSRTGRNWSRGEAVVPLVFSAYLVAFIAQVWTLPQESTRYPYLLIVCIVGLFFWVIPKYVYTCAPADMHAHDKQDQRSSDESPRTYPGVAALYRCFYKPIWLMIVTLVTPYVMSYLGFTIATTLFLAVLFVIFGNRHLTVIIGLSVGFALFFFVVMAIYLRVPLPSFAWADLPFGL